MMINLQFAVLFVVCLVSNFYWIEAEDLPPPCSSLIYCHGRLLHTVQMAEIFADSKTFVDMKLRKPTNETLLAFDKFMNSTRNHPRKVQIHKFVQDNFEPPGKEFEKWNLTDWVAAPEFLKGIKNPEYRHWASDLNGLWNFLGRKMVDDVKQRPDLYSIIYVPNPVIVPGGRFREFYYWDSYWIVRGLLLSEMHETVKGMLTNFLSIVDTFGFIPNGGRIYYARRSQPPLLIPMIKDYVDATHDEDFIAEHIATMEVEFAFWMKNHTVKVPDNEREYELFLYGDSSTGPRPESYKEDINSAKNFATDEAKEEFYAELKAGAESGWDFSSRWFVLDGTNEGNLTNLHTRSIIPVDLNAIMYWNANILKEFFLILNNETAAEYYGKIANDIKEAVHTILWDDDEGCWLDYDLINNKRRPYFYPTNVAPLWTGCFDKDSALIQKVIRYLKKSNDVLLSMAEVPSKNHLGGIPTTFRQTGEQWDYPNAWPPLQHILVLGLNNTGDPYGQELAFEIADKWVRSNFIAYNQSKAMYEKYDARTIGGHGGGGEYEVQLGFGWSNGVILDLLDKYGWKMDLVNIFDDAVEALPLSVVPLRAASAGGETRTFMTVLFALTSAIAAGLIGILVCKLWPSQTVREKLRIGRLRGQYNELRST